MNTSDTSIVSGENPNSKRKNDTSAISVRFVRSKHDKYYLVMDTTGLYDTTLSWKAKGILAYLLSLPDDWTIYLSEIVNHSTDKEASLTTGIAELINHGYIERIKTRGNHGHFKGWSYTVYEVTQSIDSNCNQLPSMKELFGNKSTTVEHPLSNPPKLENQVSVKQAQIIANPPKLDFPTSENPILLSINNTKYSIPSIKNNDNAFCDAKSSLSLRVINYYFKKYQEHRGREHPNLKDNQVRAIAHEIDEFDYEYGAQVEGFEQMIDAHFTRTDKLKTDYNINHFATNGIMQNLFNKYVYYATEPDQSEPEDPNEARLREIERL